MTLKLRLFLSTLTLSLAITAAFGFVMRSSLKRTESERFFEAFRQTVQELEAELGNEPARLRAVLEPICAHDPLVDSALVGVLSGTLGPRLLSLRARVPDLKQSLGLGELMLVSGTGQELAGDLLESEIDGELLSDRAERRLLEPGFRSTGAPAFEAACIKRRGQSWVGLIGATYLRPLLDDAARRGELHLTLEPPAFAEDSDRLEQAVALDTLNGARVYASRSRSSLNATLKDLDLVVLTVGAGTLIAALLFSFFLSRSLSRPVVLFAESTRRAMQGTVQELPVTGGPELAQAARAFNRTLHDLEALRARLGVTEKIAARREVARQIAHEIKNPLSPIRTSIETLQKLKARNLPEFDAYFEETTNTVLHEVQRLSRLVGHFAEYARVPSPKPESLDVGVLVQEIARLHENLGADIELHSEKVFGDEKPKDRELRVMGDRDQVAQILTNLLKNALEATRHMARPRVTISARKVQEDDREGVEITVADNGDGVPDSALSKLFEPYATTKKEGTGLGLPISHRIAIEHGGDLTYKTGDSGGAAFVLYLPTLGPPTLGGQGDGQGDREE